MISKAEARQIVNDLFEEEALILGGLFAVYRSDDDLIWRLMKSLESLRGRTLRRIADSDQPPPESRKVDMPDMAPHPAVEDFLARIHGA